MQLIESTIKSFNEISDDKQLDDLIGSVVIFAKTCKVKKYFIKHHHLRRIPKRIDDHPETIADIDFLKFYCKEW